MLPILFLKPLVRFVNTDKIQIFICLQELTDYVMYLSEYEKPSSSNLEVLDSKTTSPMKICWGVNKENIGSYRFPDSPECRETREFRDLSEHFPLVAEFTFETS